MTISHSAANKFIKEYNDRLCIKKYSKLPINKKIEMINKRVKYVDQQKFQTQKWAVMSGGASHNNI